MAESRPRLVVFSSLFPSRVQPTAGLFIRERMFRVGRILPLVVVAPVPWFPLQGLIRLIRPNYRPMPPKHEMQDGIEVWYPRFLSVPGILRAWDGFFMAFFCRPIMARLKREFCYEIIDAHFAYPDGYAATLLGKWLDVPVTITLRGTEIPQSKERAKRRRLLIALNRAVRIFSVADALKRHVTALGADPDRILVIGNGVDVNRFIPLNKIEARRKLRLSEDARVLVSVGGLVERKGFHRVIECLPALLKQFPNLMYLIVGGACAEGDWSQRLRDQVQNLGLQSHVRFLGVLAPEELKWPLSASDVFVLPTRNEGWANVFLEAMACGLPVVTTDVGGNREVVVAEELGAIVPFGDAHGLLAALRIALDRSWDRSHIIGYARANSWDTRIVRLVEEFDKIASLRITEACNMPS